MHSSHNFISREGTSSLYTLYGREVKENNVVVDGITQFYYQWLCCSLVAKSETKYRRRDVKHGGL